jgi:hypothetical protein
MVRFWGAFPFPPLCWWLSVLTGQFDKGNPTQYQKQYCWQIETHSIWVQRGVWNAFCEIRQKAGDYRQNCYCPGYMERDESRRQMDQSQSGCISSTKHWIVSIISWSPEQIYFLSSVQFYIHMLIVIYSYSASNSRLPSMSMGPPAVTHAHALYPNDPTKSSIYPSNVASTSTIAHYDPYAPPRRPSGSLAPTPSSSSSGPKPPGFKQLSYHKEWNDWYLHLAIRFKDSPFFTIDQAVSSVVECPGKPCFLRAVRRLNHLFRVY